MLADNTPSLLRVFQPVLARLVLILLNLGRQLTVLDCDLFLVHFLHFGFHPILVASVLCSHYIISTETEKYSLSCHISNPLYSS